MNSNSSGSNVNRAGLTDAQRALLERRLRGESAMPATAPAPLESGQSEMSFAQARMWFLSQLHPSSTAYNMHDAFRVRGALDRDALQRSLAVLTQRHAALRTRIKVADDGSRLPSAWIEPSADARIVWHDLSSLGECERELALSELAAREAQWHFELDKPPLFRLAVAPFSDDDHAIFFTIHHIISDEWSNQIIWRELSQLYDAARGASAQPSLAPIRSSYAAFARAQRESANSAEVQRQVEHWRRTLREPLPLLDMPLDHHRPLVQSFRGGFELSELSPDATRELRSLARESKATTHMAHLALYAALLFRFTQQSDIVIGVPIANRARAETESVVGLFLNSLAIRLSVRGDMNFRQLLEHVRECMTTALENSDAPFDMLVDRLNPNRDLGRNPIFQTMFVQRHGDASGLHANGLASQRIEIDGGVSKFDLTMFVGERGDVVETAVEFATDLFDRDTLRRLLDHFRQLADSVAAMPDAPIEQLEILGARERHKIEVEWNDTSRDYPRDAMVDQLIHLAGARNPAAIAAVCGDEQLSYAELEARAEAIAQALRAHGVGPNVPVGLCVERSIEMVVGIVAILKSGGAYVPLDPAYPRERLAHMLGSAKANIVLTTTTLRSLFAQSSVNALAIDAPLPIVEPPQSHRLARTSDDLAYIIFTSGSTGLPKGVMVSHKNLAHSTLARDAVYGAPVERFLLLSSFSFDSSVVGIFWSLMSGGTLVLPKPREELDVQRIAELLARHRITHTLCLPSLYDVILQHAADGQLASLKVAIVAGEACASDIAVRHHEHAPHAMLFNEYGPTEATVWATAYVVEKDAPAPIAIGKPIPNMRCYILDERGQSVPIGVSGELHIAGEGLSRGYVNGGAATAERFSVSRSGERLYRTGDVARYRPNGDIVFLGRRDDQVKIRGHRVEIAEIEATLRHHSAVSDAIVVVRQPEIAHDDEALFDALLAMAEPDARALIMSARQARVAPSS